MAQLETFVRISEVLTGEPQLDSNHAAGLFNRLRATPEAVEHLDGFLLKCDEILNSPTTDIEQRVHDEIMSNAVLCRIAAMVVVLWYFNELRTSSSSLPAATPEQHFRSLFWKIVRAHPPALSGGYFGHWTYPPD